MKKVGFGLLALVIVAGTLFFVGRVNFADRSLAGRWTIKIKNLEGELVSTLQVEFTQEPAVSCLGSDFKAVQVLDYETIDDTFFPANGPVGYRLSNGEISIGRAHVCDNYLILKGELVEDRAIGEYWFTTMGASEQLGVFSLTRDS